MPNKNQSYKHKHKHFNNTVTLHVSIIETYEFKIRKKISFFFIRLACKILKMNIDIKEKVKDKKKTNVWIEEADEISYEAFNKGTKK